ncbi:MAG TPA: ABC transporter permease [Acidimicrobiales bacterium]
MPEPLVDPGLETGLHAADQVLEVTVPAASAAVETVDAGRPRGKRQVAMWLAISWLTVLTFLAVFADALPFVDSYTKTFPGQYKKPPSWDHWFGTTKIGKDVFSLTVYGARLSLLIAATAIVFGLLVGGTLGLIAGYFRGRADGGISMGVDIMLAFPPLVLALAMTNFTQDRIPRAAAVILVLAILSIPALTRVVRASTLVYSNREFVVAARSVGAKNGRVIFREVLPNVMPSMLTFALTGLALLIIAEGALAFLGSSVAPPQATWGRLIGEGRTELEDAWWISLLPSAVLFLTVLSFNLLGDILSKRFDIRESSL